MESAFLTSAPGGFSEHCGIRKFASYGEMKLGFWMPRTDLVQVDEFYLKCRLWIEIGWHILSEFYIVL